MLLSFWYWGLVWVWVLIWWLNSYGGSISIWVSGSCGGSVSVSSSGSGLSLCLGSRAKAQAGVGAGAKAEVKVGVTIFPFLFFLGTLLILLSFFLTGASSKGYGASAAILWISSSNNFFRPIQITLSGRMSI